MFSCPAVYFYLSCIVYKRGGYIEVVSGMAERSMQAAVEEVRTLAEYSRNGEVIKYCLCCPSIDFYWILVGDY